MTSCYEDTKSAYGWGWAAVVHGGMLSGSFRVEQYNHGTGMVGDVF